MLYYNYVYKITLFLFQFTVNFLDEMTGYVPNKCPILSVAEYTNEDVTNLKNKLRSLFIHLTYSSTQSKEHIFKILDNDKSAFIMETFKQRKLDIAVSLLKQHNAGIKPTLNNFDWKVNWVVGSSVSPSLKYPIMNLDLPTLHKVDGKTKEENVSLELTKDELDSLILCLENISKQE